MSGSRSSSTDVLRVASAGCLEGPWTNRLQTESSPYLLRHAHQPVDWYPWSAEAFERAASLGRPVFLSIGYMACHWCHIMERESFSDPMVAALLNASFICIKVDREEQPDVDAYYIAALLEMTGDAGWPACLFLTPDRRPFRGGTYFPPHYRFGLPSFRSVLAQVQDSWQRDRQRVERSAGRVAEALLPPTQPEQAGALPLHPLQDGLNELLEHFDHETGGWGGGARFPHSPRLRFLLEAAAMSLEGVDTARSAAHQLLDAMDRGGLHDHVGGGFHRYTVDADWQIPHFEKMLYDNAQLAWAYAVGWRLLGHQRWLTVACDTLEYLIAELQAEDGLFQGSQDADDPEGEGVYYSWTPTELEAVLGATAPAFAKAYGVRPGGNFEGGRSVLHREGEGSILSAVRSRLRRARAKRPPPALDTKKITSWNAMTIGALALTGRLSGAERYIEIAQHTADALLGHQADSGRLPRVCTRRPRAGVLEDHAATAEALIELHQATGEPRWLLAASRLGRLILDDFQDPGTGVLSHAALDAHEVPLARFGWEDTAEPSATGVALKVLATLVALGDVGIERSRVEAAFSVAASHLAARPGTAPTVLAALHRWQQPPTTVVIAGPCDAPQTVALHHAARARWAPELLIVVTDGRPALVERFGLLRHKGGTGPPMAFVCEGTSCSLPLQDPQRLSAELREAQA